jgi:hypothetical protein
MALSGSKRAAAARSPLTNSEPKSAANSSIALSACEQTSGKTRNPCLDRQQMTSGQVWAVGRWSEAMLDQLLRCTVGLTGPRTDDTSASRWRKQGCAQRAPPHSLLVPAKAADRCPTRLLAAARVCRARQGTTINVVDGAASRKPRPDRRGRHARPSRRRAIRGVDCEEMRASAVTPSYFQASCCRLSSPTRR